MSRSRPAANRCPRSKTSFPASGAPSSSITCATHSCASACPTWCRSVCFDTASVRHKMPIVPDCRPGRAALSPRAPRRRRHAAADARGRALADRASRQGVADIQLLRARAQIRSGTGFRGQGGRADYTVYSQIRFPLAEAPAYAGTADVPPRAAHPHPEPSDIQPAQIAQNPWRDNFCERRGFSVGQCPAASAIRARTCGRSICRPAPSADRCDPPGDVVAARDGVILRSLRQEAAYLFVNSANEHIRFRYMHMSPRKMDADNLLSGRRVYEGEVIGEVGNYSIAGERHQLSPALRHPGADQRRLGVRQSLHDAGGGL